MARVVSRKRGCLVSLLIRTDFLNFDVVRLEDSVQPEAVALLFKDGSIFGVTRTVVVIGGHINNYRKVQNADGNIFERYEEFILGQPALGREVLRMGDLNAYNRNGGGWEEDDSIFTGVQYRKEQRESRCTSDVPLGVTMGRDFLCLTQACYASLMAYIVAYGLLTDTSHGPSQGVAFALHLLQIGFRLLIISSLLKRYCTMLHICE